MRDHVRVARVTSRAVGIVGRRLLPRSAEQPPPVTGDTARCHVPQVTQRVVLGPAGVLGWCSGVGRHVVAAAMPVHPLQDALATTDLRHDLYAPAYTDFTAPRYTVESVQGKCL